MNTIYDVLLGMIETEKTVNKLQVLDKYTFIVAKGSTKIDVKNAVEKIYGVNVVSVNKLPVRLKSRTIGRGRYVNKRKAFIKAVVTIKPGEKIDLIAFKEQKK